MKKVMISQPMRGLTADQILKNRKNVVDSLVNMGYEVVDSVHQDYPGEEVKEAPIWYLGKSIQYMSEVDILYMMNGWGNARGCKIEHDVAIEYGLEVMYQGEA